METGRERGELGGGGKEGCNFPSVTGTKSDDYRDQAGDAGVRTGPGLCTLNIEEHIFLAAT